MSGVAWIQGHRWKIVKAVPNGDGAPISDGQVQIRMTKSKLAVCYGQRESKSACGNLHVRLEFLCLHLYPRS